MKKRIEWFDSLKGLCILLVVYCHYVILPNDTLLGNTLMALASGAVPCFMMVSGALMHSASTFSWKKYFQKLLKIYLSMCAWRIVYLVISYIVYGISFSKTDFLSYMFLFGQIELVPSEVMWYMVALLLVLLIYPLSYSLLNGKDSDGKAYSFLLLLSFVSGFFVPAMNYILSLISKIFDTPAFDISGLYQVLPLRQYSNLLFFFLLGGLLYKYNDAILQKLHSVKHYKLIPYGLIIIGTLSLMVMKYTMSGTFLWQGISIEEGYSRISTIVLSTGLWLAFSTSKNKASHILAKYFGKYTMGIYYLHFIILYMCSIYIYPHIPEYTIGMNLLKTIIISIASAIITRIMLHIPFVKEMVK